MAEKTITIFGTSRAKPGEPVYDMAYQIGKLLAESGFAIANGGYGGTMQAAAKGAAEQAGKVTGVTCSVFSSRPNEYSTDSISTNSLEKRLENLIEIGDAYVVLQGGTGTLLELAFVWELKNKSFFEMEKPVILIGDFWKPLVDLMEIDNAKSGRCIKIINHPEDLKSFLECVFKND